MLRWPGWNRSPAPLPILVSRLAALNDSPNQQSQQYDHRKKTNRLPRNDHLLFDSLASALGLEIYQVLVNGIGN
jgi:hypothetical protein